jgi:hypothetical protein
MDCKGYNGTHRHLVGCDGTKASVCKAYPARRKANNKGNPKNNPKNMEKQRILFALGYGGLVTREKNRHLFIKKGLPQRVIDAVNASYAKHLRNTPKRIANQLGAKPVKKHKLVVFNLDVPMTKITPRNSSITKRNRPAPNGEGSRISRETFVEKKCKELWPNKTVEAFTDLKNGEAIGADFIIWNEPTLKTVFCYVDAKSEVVTTPNEYRLISECRLIGTPYFAMGRKGMKDLTKIKMVPTGQMKPEGRIDI